MKHLIFPRFTTNHFSDLSRFPRFFCVNNNNKKKISPQLIMSDEDKTISQSETTTSDSNNNNNVVVLVKEKEAETAEIPPPPPEKPLPGDCCGSGCVRCVWDIYYEELDEYNKLLKNNSAAKNDK